MKVKMPVNSVSDLASLIQAATRVRSMTATNQGFLKAIEKAKTSKGSLELLRYDIRELAVFADVLSGVKCEVMAEVESHP